MVSTSYRSEYSNQNSRKYQCLTLSRRQTRILIRDMEEVRDSRLPSSISHTLNLYRLPASDNFHHSDLHSLIYHLLPYAVFEFLNNLLIQHILEMNISAYKFLWNHRIFVRFHFLIFAGKSSILVKYSILRALGF